MATPLNKGESVKSLLSLWLPELFSFFFSLSPALIDAFFIASLKSNTIYGACVIATNFLHIIIKCSEALPVATIIVVGNYNGAKEYKKCGKALIDVLWTSVIMASIQALFVYHFAHHIYLWMGGTEKMIAAGVPFLKLRALSGFPLFILSGLFGFMRGVKDTITPMYIGGAGIIVFIICDYFLVLGGWGIPAYGLIGSAYASLIQYTFMIIISLVYLFTKKSFRTYFTENTVSLFSIQPAQMLKISCLSLPVMLDKASLSISYGLLTGSIASMGKYYLNSYDVILKLERHALLPAIAFAQIATLVVSNRFGIKDIKGARSSIKKIMILTAGMVCSTLFILWAFSPFFIQFYDQKNRLSPLILTVLPVISLLVVFDFIQIILAAALRGAGKVFHVMFIRTASCLLFFYPLCYFFTYIFPTNNSIIRFTLVYSSFYLNTALMGLLFLYVIKRDKWTQEDDSPLQST